MDIAVRRAHPEDSDALAVVGTATFLESYSGVIDGAGLVRHCAEKQTAPVYAKALADPAQALWLAELAPGASPVGYMHLTAPDLPIETLPTDLEVKRIYVLGKLQGSGLGRRLIALAQEEARARGARRLLLGVYKGNESALAFYDRVGFAIAGERSFDVGGDVYDDWVLAKTI